MQAWLAANKLMHGMPGLGVIGAVKESEGFESFNLHSKYGVLVAKFRFEAGKTYMQVELRKYQGKWLIDFLSVNSPGLLQTFLGAKIVQKQSQCWQKDRWRIS